MFLDHENRNVTTKTENFINNHTGETNVAGTSTARFIFATAAKFNQAVQFLFSAMEKQNAASS